MVAALVLLLLSAYFFHAHKARYVIAGPAVLALGCLLLLAAKPAIRIFAAALMVGAIAGLYATELISRGVYNDDLPIQNSVRKAATAAGIQYDPRTRLEAILEDRSAGVNAYPPFYPYLLVGDPLKIAGEKIIPLGNHSQVFVVACNEGGQYLTYTTDQYGFPNPNVIWKNPLDIAIVGDSNAVGECVPQADSIAGQLRTKFPQTVTLGAGGHGPIFTLASIREYLRYAKPRQVLWIYSESHTPQYLEVESHSPFMLRYVDDPEFSQKLIDKQPELDKAIDGYVDSGIRQALHAHSWATSFKDFLVLKNVRTLEFDYRARLHPPQPIEFNAPLFERILQQGSREVQAWGGQVTLVYWPDAARYPGIANYSPGLRRRHDGDRSKVLDICSRLGIRVIDVTTVFPDLPAARAHENDRYFYSFPAHYTPEGYRTASKAIISALGNPK
ncbi:MAG: hypothetical protein WAM71_09075 [Candidatus Korobacteraceae bacterium]